MRSPNRIIALVVGAVLLLLGAAGFAVTGGSPFFDVDGALLLETFSANPAQNVAHLVLGAALALGAVSGVRPSRIVNSWIGAVCLGLGMFGLFAVGTPANVLALNGVGNVVHFAASTVLLAVGLGAERERRPRADA